MGLPALELTRDRIISELEQGARARLRCSAQDLIQRYQAGELTDPGAVADLLALAHLLREDDPLFAGLRPTSVSPR